MGSGMNRLRRIGTTVLVAWCALVMMAGTVKGQSSPPAPAFKIEDLAWMTGDWETAPGGRMQIDEHWTHVAGGSMVGMARTVAGGKMVFFEYLRVETRPDGIYYVAHPKARTPGTDFKLVKLDGQSATFENLQHDFPKRIIYRKNADGSMTARVEGDGTEKEKPQDFLYQPIPRK